MSLPILPHPTPSFWLQDVGSEASDIQKSLKRLPGNLRPVANIPRLGSVRGIHHFPTTDQTFPHFGGPPTDQPNLPRVPGFLYPPTPAPHHFTMLSHGGCCRGFKDHLTSLHRDPGMEGKWGRDKVHSKKKPSSSS